MASTTPEAPSETPRSGVSVTSHRDTLVLGFLRRFTVAEAVPFRQCLEQLLPQHPLTRRVVLDFSRTDLIDSSGLGSLITNLKQARSRSVPVEAWSAGPR